MGISDFSHERLMMSVKISTRFTQILRLRSGTESDTFQGFSLMKDLVTSASVIAFTMLLAALWPKKAHWFSPFQI